MAVHVSFQLSAVLQPDPAFPLLQNINRYRDIPFCFSQNQIFQHEQPDTDDISLIKIHASGLN